MQANAPLKKSKSLVHLRRTTDLFGKAWAYLMTTLLKPGQLFRVPVLLARSVHIGEFLKLNQPWLKESGIKTVIDVGAHAGEFSSAIHAILNDAHVYAFEPLPDCCSKLKTKLGNNGFLNVFQVALGDHRGTIQFWRSTFSKSSSVLRMSALHEEAFPWTAGGTPIAVQLQTLDDYADRMNLTSKTLLKIDVQGFEDRVLRGAVKTLKKVDYVIVEVSVAPLYDEQALFDAIYEFLQQAGFQYIGNLEQLTSPLDGTILQVDALFKRNPCEAAQEAA
jgi:FkbM family methyltransferase